MPFFFPMPLPCFPHLFYFFLSFLNSYFGLALLQSDPIVSLSLSQGQHFRDLLIGLELFIPSGCITEQRCKSPPGWKLYQSKVRTTMPSVCDFKRAENVVVFFFFYSDVDSEHIWVKIKTLSISVEECVDERPNLAQLDVGRCLKPRVKSQTPTQITTYTYN